MLNPSAKRMVIGLASVTLFSGISSANISQPANQNFTAIESDVSKPDSALNQLMKISSEWGKTSDDGQPVLFNNENSYEIPQSSSVNSVVAAGFSARGGYAELFGGSLQHITPPPPVPVVENNVPPLPACTSASGETTISCQPANNVSETGSEVLNAETDDSTNTDSFGKFGAKESFWDKIKRFSGYFVIAFNSAVGHIKDTLLNPLPSLNAISEKLVSMVRGSGNNSQDPDYKGSFIGEEGFMSELETLTNSKFTDNNYVWFLAGGEESFAMKDKLMKEAKKSIYVTSYAFHDDITGHETANILAKKKETGS